jgi:3-oxoacyl-[acyl-carrier protein] reductase
VLDPKVEERVVLVTGTNNPYGIGAAIAAAFAAQGARVFLHYFRWTPRSGSGARSGADGSPGESFYYSQQTKSIDEVLERVRKSGAQVAALEADLVDPALITTLFDRAEATLGPVEVLVNNAAYWEADTFLPSSTDLPSKLVELWTDRPQSLNLRALDRMFAVNTRAPALMIAEFARRHIKRSAQFGRIINVSTAGAERFPSEVTYAASKFALESFTRSAAAELGRFGVTVNALSLGPVQTGWITAELEQAILPTIPLARIGTPEEVADVVLFLASHQARWLTGQRIYVGEATECKSRNEIIPCPHP